eukprot:TRINITY_DN16762_c0_g2_i6.p3 TRINITY_DN16762_c0_g2~~TRINITY_DN16762_c0_g2_i6.p3  ORF type:complete len:122 (-),score=2.16 TRINITY_DN16762_c0_g2_i6:283-648(-)
MIAFTSECWLKNYIARTMLRSLNFTMQILQDCFLSWNYSKYLESFLILQFVVCIYPATTYYMHALFLALLFWAIFLCFWLKKFIGAKDNPKNIFKIGKLELIFIFLGDNYQHLRQREVQTF